MARGWESKSVEEQQSQAGMAPTGSRQQLTPEQMDRRRELDTLNLARKNLLNQLQTTKNERHRQMLEKALAELDQRITQVG